MREYWIEGVYEKNKIGDVWLDLPAEQKREAVEPQIKKQLANPDYQTLTLNSGTQLTDVFRRTGRALLILGAPGSGKTMALLELAEDLIAEAKKDDTRPIPVVVNLASWAEKQPEKLEDWLTERLNREYGVSRKLADQLVGDSAFLWLLDGLDEVPETSRDACVTAINNYWKRISAHVDNGIIVCSRIEEYEKLTQQLNLQNAIQLGKLTPEQSDGYLAQLGSAWESLRAALKSDTVLREFADSPLILNIMAIAYQGLPIEEITEFANDKIQTQHLFNSYVDRCLALGNVQTKYSHDQTRHYLGWLADNLFARKQIVFQIENLKTSWLPKSLTSRYRITVPLLGAVGLGLTGGFIGREIGKLLARIGFGFTVTSIGELFFSTVGQDFFGWVGCLIFGLLTLLLLAGTLNVSDYLSWTWHSVLINLKLIILFSLFGSAVFGLGLVFLFGYDAVVVYYGIHVPTIVALTGGGICMLIGLFIGGVKQESLEIRVTANRGIYRSLHNALRRGVFLGAVIGFALGINLDSIFAESVISEYIFNIALLSGIGASLLFGLYFCGSTVIKHTMIRVFIWRSGHAPLNYAKFLKYTTERGLTRQVGGGFVFRHRLLMEHFAKSEW